jgi:hypothetical protein
VTPKINENKLTKRPAIVMETSKNSEITGITPTILKNVDNENAIKNKLNVIFLSIIAPSI